MRRTRHWPLGSGTIDLSLSEKHEMENLSLSETQLKDLIKNRNP